MTVCPRYDQYKDAWDTCVVVQVHCLLYIGGLTKSSCNVMCR